METWAPLTFDVDDLKLRDLAKLCFQTNYDEIEIKKSAKISFYLRHRYCVTEKRHQNSVTRFSILGSPNQNFWLMPVYMKTAECRCTHQLLTHSA